MKLSYYYYSHLNRQLSPEDQAQVLAPKSRSMLGLAIELDELLILAEDVCRRQKDPLFVLRTALKTLPPGHGVLGLLVQSYATLGEACSSGYRFQHLSRSAMHSYLEYTGNRVLSCVDMEDYDPENVAIMVEYYQGSLVAIANYLVDGNHPVCAQEIHFMHTPRAPVARYQKLFGCERIYFSQPSNRIMFARSIMDLPIERGDGGAKQVLLTEAKAQLNSLLGQHSLSERVRQLLLAPRTFIPLSMAGCARELNLTESTLKRRLQKESTSYKAIMDDILANLAKQYLINDAQSIQEISIALGFSDRSAFARFFKRWVGMSPLQYRQQQVVSIDQ